jgi:threonyl-tRNA synthetase
LLAPPPRLRTNPRFFRQGGFFYEFFLQPKGEGASVASSEDFANLEKRAEAFAREKRSFERMTVSRDFALRMFAYNDFKRYPLSPSGKRNCPFSL